MNKNMKILIGIVIVVGLILILKNNSTTFMVNYAGDSGGGSNNNPSEITTYYAVIDMNPKSICVGESATGSISSNIKLGTCNIYYDSGTGYLPLKTIALNINGYYSYSQAINNVGSVKFKADCLSQTGWVATNVVTLTSQACAQQNCVDTDGGIKEFIAGSVTYQGIQYNDNCKTANSVNEYYCDDLGQMSLGALPCANGCEGGRCLTQAPANCVDSDGGQDDQFMIYGTCESSVTQSGTFDQCINGLLIETYCGADKTCKTSTVGCGAEQICYGGKCVIANSICDYGCQLAGYDNSLCVNFNINGAVSMEQTCANNNGNFANVYNACSIGQICCCR